MGIKSEMSTKLDIYYNRKAIKDLVADIDYVAKLSDSERDWLSMFVNATAGGDMDAQAAITDTPEKFRKLYKESYDESNARSRDMVQWFNRAPFKEHSEEDEDEYTIEALVSIKSATFAHYKCSRCCRLASRCDCPKRQRHSPYGVEDYTPTEQTEDDMISAIDLKRRLQAYDLLPYGDNPDLEPGNIVQICLPLHLLRDAVGTVLAYRPDDNAYLIEVKSKNGLRDRDGTPHTKPLIWVRGQGLRRFKLSIKMN